MFHSPIIGSNNWRGFLLIPFTCCDTAWTAFGVPSTVPPIQFLQRRSSLDDIMRLASFCSTLSVPLTFVRQAEHGVGVFRKVEGFIGTVYS